MRRKLQRAGIRTASRNSRRLKGAAALAGGASLAIAAPAGAANFTVTEDGDSGGGTLRDAIAQANATTEFDTITIDPSVTMITLTTGSIQVGAIVDQGIYAPDVPAGGLAIEGHGSGSLTISGDGDFSGTPSAGDSRIFTIGYDGFTQLDDYALSGMTLTDGYAKRTLENDYGSPTWRGNSGGAILADQSAGAITLDDMVLSDNVATQVGGGIALIATSGVELPSLSVSGTVVTGNTSYQGGGGIWQEAGYFDMTNTTVSDNVVTDRLVSGASGTNPGFGSRGGGVFAGGLGYGYANDEDITISRSTISGNEIQGSSNFSSGGGLQIGSSQTGKTLISNSTFSGNSAPRSGGGIYLDSRYGNSTTIENSTITGNTASVGSGISGTIYNRFNSTAYDNESRVLSSTVVAGNSQAGGATDLAGTYYGPRDRDTFAAEFSAIGTVADNSAVTDLGSNQFGQTSPGLEALGDNGGATLTHSPTSNSPLLDAGKSNGLAQDQRGEGRTTDLPGANAADGTDIGSVERLTGTGGGGGGGGGDDKLEGLDVDAKKKQKIGGKIKVKISVACEVEPCSATTKGSFKLGSKKVKLQKEKASIDAGERNVFRLQPKGNKKQLKKFAKKAKKLDKKGKKVRANVSVKASDDAGNTLRQRRTVRLVK